jgi:crotonobetainyl-CoA:carnitine CoA-transferase CaiB-like acyl-CoA transferase
MIIMSNWKGGALGLPLDGVNVLEVAIFAFVPSSTAILAEWGADVVKVEHPVSGDPQRRIAAWGVPEEVNGIRHLFEFANRGKRSIGIDLAKPAGRALLLDLVDGADVFVTNFLPPARRKLGIEPDDVLGRNPRIVYARGSAQGPRGDAAERGGFDSISYWGRSGAAIGVTPPEAEWPLTMPGPGFGDLQAGMALAGGIAAGLFHRERTGRGTVVDVSLLGVGVWAMGMTVSGTSVLGVDTLPHLYHDDAVNPLVNLYRTSDGELVSLGFLQADRYWPQFCALVGRDDLLADARFADAAAREANAGACVSVLEELFAGRTLAEWEALLSRQDGQWDVIVPPGRVRHDPQVVANGYVDEVDHGTGAVTLARAPAQFDGRLRPLGRAPEQGADTAAVLKACGVTAEQLAALRAGGVIA